MLFNIFKKSPGKFSHPYLEHLETGVKRTRKKIKKLKKKEKSIIFMVDEIFPDLAIGNTQKYITQVNIIEKRLTSMENLIKDKDEIYSHFEYILNKAGNPKYDCSNSTVSLYFTLPTNELNKLCSSLSSDYQTVINPKYCNTSKTKVRVSDHGVKEDDLSNHGVGLSIVIPSKYLDVNRVVRLARDLETVKRLKRENPGQIEEKIGAILKRYNSTFHTPTVEEIKLINEIKSYSLIKR